jgi:glycosyltransferase involved in cell wall biosynthesis
MKDLIIVVPNLVKTGGMDRPNLAVATRALSRGYRVTAIAHRAAPELDSFPNFRLVKVPRPLGSVMFGEALLDLRARREKRRRRSATVLGNGGNHPRADVSWAHYVHAAERIPPHGGLFRRLYDRAKRRRNIWRERAAFRYAELVIADSNRCRDDVMRYHGVDPARSVTVYYGIDPEAFKPVSPDERATAEMHLGLPPNERRCLFVGGIGDRRKGLDTLLEAWRQVSSQREWDTKLLVVGSGRALQTYRELARQWHIQDTVHFLGFRHDVDELLRAANCLVAPTRYEPYGLAVHEAICVGLPAIVSSTAGVAERYPPNVQSLLLRDPDDPAELAAVLRRWKDDERRYAVDFGGFGAVLRARTWDQMADDFLDLIETRARRAAFRGSSP